MSNYLIKQNLANPVKRDTNPTVAYLLFIYRTDKAIAVQTTFVILIFLN